MEEKSKTIVIVDDDPTDALFAISIIKKHRPEYEVLFLDEGKELINYLNTNGSPLPQAIFLDMHMPVMSGLDVLRKVDRLKLTEYIPLIMLTSSRYEKDITESYRLGATGYIIKPLDQQKFLDIIDQLRSIKSEESNRKIK